jgi:hypothetical protein
MNFRIYSIGCVLVFMLALVDAHQDLSSPFEPVILTIGYIGAVGLATTAPLALLLCVWVGARRLNRPSAIYGFAGYLLLLVSIFTWAAAVYGGKSPAEGASQMHLIIFPIIFCMVAIALVLISVLIDLTYTYAVRRRT